MFIVSTIASNGLRLHSQERARFDTTDQAAAFVRSTFDVLELEADPDHPGCFDFVTRSLVVGSIQPAGFTL